MSDGARQELEILLVDDDSNRLQRSAAAVGAMCRLTLARNVTEAFEALVTREFQAIIVHQALAGGSGLELLARARKRKPAVWRLIVAAPTHGAELLPAIDRGDIQSVLQDPLSPQDLSTCAEAMRRATHGSLALVLVVDRDEARGRQIAEALYATGELLGLPQRTSETTASPAVMILVEPDSPRDVDEALQQLGGPDRKAALMVALPMEAVGDASGHLAAGADDLLWLPVRGDEVRLRYRTWRGRRLSEHEAERVREVALSQPPLQGIIGRSEPMRRVFQWIHRVAPSDSSVLLLGETGTGKELIARTIHHLSGRHAGPFVAVNLSALPESLIESELFGHTAGAFTGARASRRGLLEEASGGTLFLDEVGDLSAGVQVKLLRVLQERQFTPVGSTTVKDADFRLICATHRDLEEMVATGAFRQDLYYRINVVHIDVPPLRRRTGDVELLADHFLAHYTQLAGVEGLTLGEDARDALRRHDWPGNVRELEHIIERTVALSRSGDTVGADLVVRRRAARQSFRGELDKFWTSGRGLRELLEDIERQILLETLQRYDGNRVAAARKLKIPRQTLQSRLKKLGIDA